jgi:hypothetical protein
LLSRKVGNQATNSFEPITGKTSNSPLAPKFAFAHFEITSRSCGVPAVNGYLGELADFINSS